MTVLTSTMRMQLDVAGFVKNARELADAVGADVKKIDALKTALADSGASDRLQASMMRLGASKTHIEGLKQAMEDFRKEQGTAGKAWADLTKEQKAALRSVESAAVATMRAVIAQEEKAAATSVRIADERAAALLSRETTLRERLLAEDKKREDRRIAIMAAAATERGALGQREAIARAVIEAEITAKHRAGIVARENASREELATISRIAELEKEARVRAIRAETTALVGARTAQRRAEETALEHAKGRNGVGHMIAGTATGYVSAHAMVRPAEKAAEAGAERQTATIGMQRAGMTPAEIARARDLALKVARDVGNMTATQVMDLHKEARSAVQHPEEVFELLPDLARAASALKGMGAEGNVADLVKAGESLGLMGDKERFRKFLDSQVRAQGVMGRTVTTEQTYEAAKYTKSAGSTLSDEFLNLTLPSLIQELHGSSAGDAIAGVSKTLRGGLAHQHLAVMQLNKMGLLADPSKIVHAKGSGEIMGYTGKVKGDALLASDPDRWFNEVYKPAAEKHMGVKNMEDMNLLLAQTLGKTGANVGRIFIQQAATLAQHRENNKNAPGTEEQIRLQREDPKVAVQTFNDALDDLGAAVTGPVMGSIGLGLTDLAGYIRNVSDIAKEHPIAALTVGAGLTAGGLAASGTLAYYVATGFGLPGAAGQLSASAIALEAAATKMGAVETAKAAEDAAGVATPSIIRKLAPGLALAGPLAAVFAGITGVMLNRDQSKSLVDGGRPDVLPSDNNLGLPGFSDGGYTGPGGRDEPAGIVHRGEYVIPAGPTERHRALLDAIRRGDILPGFMGGGAVAAASGRGDALSASSPARVALATDSSSATWLREVFREGMTEALRRDRDEHDLDGEGGGSGGSGGQGGGSPSLRHGHPGSSAGLPSIRYGHDARGHARAAPDRPGHEGAGYRRTIPGHAYPKPEHLDRFRPTGPMPTGGDGRADPTSLKGLLFRGESAGKAGIYNHRVGNSYPVGGHDADTLTIGELQRRQHAGGIFAAGKYQIVPKTMDGAVKSLGLRPDEMFNSAMQDRIYTDYLADSKRPQISAYVTGKSDNLRAANVATAEEWASVGDPGEGGKSHYWRTGVNHASITVAQTQAALQKARALYQRLVGEGVDPETARRSALLGIEHPGDRPSMPSPFATEDRATRAGVAEHTPLPRTGSAAQLAPASAAPQHYAMSGAVDFDGSSVRDTLHHVRELKHELAGMKGGVKVAIEHSHRHSHEHDGGGSGRSNFHHLFAAVPIGRTTG